MGTNRKLLTRRSRIYAFYLTKKQKEKKFFFEKIRFSAFLPTFFGHYIKSLYKMQKKTHAFCKTHKKSDFTYCPKHGFLYITDKHFV